MPLGNARRVEVTLGFEPKTYDIDFAGHVSNIVYVRWLEDLRLKILADFAPLADQLKNGEGPVLLSTHIEYLKPVTILDRPVGRMRVSGVSRVRWEVEAEFHVGDTPVCKARQTGTYVNLKTGRPVRIPTGLHG